MSRNTKNEHCVICQQSFNINNIAWIISVCGHNLCNQCLKKSITSQAKEIFCKLCNKDLSVDQETLQQFPKNITILKSLRESQNNSIISSASKHTQNSENSLLFNQSNIKYITNNCPKHGKPLEIVCTLDRNLLCSHCAIFGQHQNHVFKTLDQFAGQLLLFRQNFNQIELKRQICQDSVRGKKFKTSIIAKISDKKDRLFFDIKERFARLTAAIKDAENKVFEELAKCFKNVDTQISKAIKQQQDVEKLYSKWKKQIVEYVNLVDEVIDIKSKIQVFYRPSRPTLHQGQGFLKQLQDNNRFFQSSVEQKINSIKVDYLGSLQGSIYNFAKVCTNSSQIKVNTEQDNLVYSDINEIKIPKKQMKIQFVKSELVDQIKQPFGKKQQLHKTVKSPILSKVKSNPKLTKPSFESPRKPKTPPKSHHNLHANESNKHEENKYFAQRQLYEFLHSSDTLDITGCQLTDQQILHIVEQASRQKPIKCIKLCKNKLTNVGLTKIISYLSSVTNINLSYNSLTDDCVDIFIQKRSQIPNIRIINLTHNKLNERKVKIKIEQLRKVGIITTL